MERITVIGLGYIGLPTAAFLAKAGYSVEGVDVNRGIVESIRENRVEVEEPGLSEMVRDAILEGRFSAAELPSKSDVFIIAVPTPFDTFHRVDPSYIFDAVDALTEVLEEGNLVVLESTSPPGLTDQIEQRIRERRPILFEGGTPPLFAHCPERVLPGNILFEMENNPRIVGGTSEQAALQAAEVYAKFCQAPIRTTDAKTAEAVKLSENAFRDVNIAFANELSLICDSIGVDVWELISLANLHPRVSILRPSSGVGGHCIAVDPWFLYSAAPEEARLISTARLVNDSKPNKVASKIDQLAEAGAAVGMLGITFKPDVDDIRESPALEVISGLAEQRPDITIRVFDPALKSLPEQLDRYDNVVWVDSPHEILSLSDVVGVLVLHSKFLSLRSMISSFQGQVVDAVGLLS